MWRFYWGRSAAVPPGSRLRRHRCRQRELAGDEAANLLFIDPAGHALPSVFQGVLATSAQVLLIRRSCAVEVCMRSGEIFDNHSQVDERRV